MPLTRIDSAFLDLDAIGGIDFDVQSGVPTFSVDATNHRVGIGTDTPAYLAHIHNTGTGDSDHSYLHFTTGDTGATGSDGLTIGVGANQIAYINYREAGTLSLSTSGTPRLNITSGGNVGIKIDAPISPLDILLDDGAGDPRIRFDQVSDDPFIELNRWTGTGTNYHGIRSRSRGGDLIFEFASNLTTIGNHSYSEKLRITSGGNLQVKGGSLHLDSNAELALFEDNTSGTYTNSAKIAFDFSGNVARMRSSVNGSATLRPLAFYIANTPALYIKTDANVGIGTDNPAQKLDVNGNIKSNSYLGPNTATGSLWLTVGTNTQNPSIALWARDHATYPGQAHILGRTSNASNVAGQIRFYQYHGSGWNIRGMWGKNGFFGIRSSTSDPEVPLHIDQGSAFDRTAYLTKAGDVNFRLTAANGSSTNSSGNETARFGMNYASTNSWGEYIKFVRGTSQANGSMGLYSSGDERIHIKADGNIGIGTNDPGTKLHVLGQAIISTDSSASTNDYATLVLGERAAGDSIASLEFRYDADSFSSKIDGRNKQWAVWADWNSSSHDRINVNGQTATENITLRPGGTVDVVKAEYNTSTGASATYFAGTAHFQRVDTANEGGEIRFSRSVDNANHYAIDVNGNTTTNPRLRILNVTASREDFHVSHTGNIGIGTNASSEKLVIHNGVVKLQGTSGGADTRVEFNRINGRNGWIGIPSWNDDALLIYGPGVSSGNFLAAGCEGGIWSFSGHNGTTATEGLRIGQTGNVGINTNNPIYKLDVRNGVASFEKGIRVGRLLDADINSRTNVNSGFWEVNNATTGNGWPATIGWMHLLANTHSNTSNYYSQQFASSFFDQELYFRNTNASGTTTSQSWGRVMHTNSVLKPVYAESDGSTDSWSRYFYPGGEYYTAVHSGTSNDFNSFKEQGYYHVNNTASNAPASGYGYLEIHRHQGSNYFTQKFTLSGDTSRTFFRRGSDSSGTQIFGPWNTYGSLERENTFTNHQNISGNYHLTFGPNSTWSKSLRIGGDGWQGGTNIAAVAVTNGNLHLDAADAGYAVYLNWYGGYEGTYFGDGGGNQIARMYGDGRFILGPNTSAQLQVDGQSNQALFKRQGSNCPTVIHRNDSANYYILLSNASTSLDGNWNGLRPLYINLTSGKLHSQNGQDFTGGTRVFSSMNLANIELDFTTANSKYVDFYTNNGNTVNFRMPTNANVFHTGIQMTRNSAVSLYHANSVKLYTTSTGVYVNGSYQPTSDVNLKENIITVPNALDKIKAMRGVKFNWKKDGRPDYGVIAQEAEAVVPELVADHEVKTLTQAGSLKKRPDDSDYVTTIQKGFCYDSMVGILIEAIKEQQATIDSLTARIDALENP